MQEAVGDLVTEEGTWWPKKDEFEVSWEELAQHAQDTLLKMDGETMMKHNMLLKEKLVITKKLYEGFEQDEAPLLPAKKMTFDLEFTEIEAEFFVGLNQFGKDAVKVRKLALAVKKSCRLSMMRSAATSATNTSTQR